MGVLLAIRGCLAIFGVPCLYQSQNGSLVKAMCFNVSVSFQGLVKRSVDSELADRALFFSNFAKRDTTGISTFCCIQGCTEEQMAVVC